MSKNITEIDVLTVFLEEMESRGTPRKAFRLNVDDSLVEQLNNSKKTSVDLEGVKSLVDRCIANEWLERTVMDRNGRYSSLVLSVSGLGVVRSKRKQGEVKANRSWSRKFSDFIENHKGWISLFSIIVAIATLIVTVI